MVLKKKTSMGASLAEALIKIFGSPLLPWPGKDIRLAFLATAWQGFSANGRILLFFEKKLFRPGLRRTLHWPLQGMKKCECNSSFS